MYDSLMYVKKLEAVGVPRNQAEAQVEIMSQIIDSNLATKQDLSTQGAAINYDIKVLSAELRLEIKEAILRIGRMLAVAAGIIIAAIALLIKL